mgnify:CR=1 FL=1
MAETNNKIADDALVSDQAIKKAEQYIEEEEILKRIDQLNPPAGVVGEPLFLPLRKPGGEFWSSVRQQDERKQQMDSIKRQIKE